MGALFGALPSLGGDEMKILAFDQATVRTGYAFFEDNTMGAFGLIDLHTMKQGLGLRMDAMFQQMAEEVEKYQPDVIVIEDVAMQANPSGLIALARLQGMIIGYCVMHEIGCVILKPTEWRRACGFKQGRVKREQLKQQAIDFVKDVYHLQVTDDEADAICIGTAYVASLMAAGEEKNESDERRSN